MTDRFAQEYLSEIKAEWARTSKGNPWWQQCQCGNDKSPIFDISYDASYCSNCLAWLKNKCDGSNCNYCGNRPQMYEGPQPFKLIFLS